MQQAELYRLPVDTAWQQPDFTTLFADALACLSDSLAGFADDVARFVDDVSGRSDDDHRRRDKHDVFIDNAPCR